MIGCYPCNLSSKDDRKTWWTGPLKNQFDKINAHGHEGVGLIEKLTSTRETQTNNAFLSTWNGGTGAKAFRFLCCISAVDHDDNVNVTVRIPIPIPTYMLVLYCRVMNPAYQRRKYEDVLLSDIRGPNIAFAWPTLSIGENVLDIPFQIWNFNLALPAQN